jgi:hypothetical protein
VVSAADLHAIASNGTERAPNLRKDCEGGEPEERRPSPSQGGVVRRGEAAFLPGGGMWATVGVGEAGGVAEGMACGTHRRARGSSEFKTAEERLGALTGFTAHTPLAHNHCARAWPDEQIRMGNLQHYEGKNSTSCDKSSPKCCTVYKILLRDIWFFQYCDFCRRKRAMSSRADVYIGEESTPSLVQTLTGCLAYRQGSVRGSIFCPVFSEEVLQRVQVYDNRSRTYGCAPCSSNGGGPANECSGCVKQEYLNRSSALWQTGRGCQVKSSYVVSE